MAHLIMDIAEFKNLPLEVAVKDGRTRQTVIAGVEAAAAKWSFAEMSVNRLIRGQKALRSTERRFVGEAIWSIVRRYESLRALARQLLPDAEPARATLLIYFLWLTLYRGLDPELARPHLRQAGLPENPETWAAAWAALHAGLDREHAFALQHSFPLWVSRRLLRFYGDAADALADALNHRAAIDLRVNIAHTTRQAALERLRAEGVIAVPTPYSPWGIRLEGHVNINSIPSFQAGLVDVQDEGSQLLALLTGGAPDETVADVCAGGGGKLSALAPLVQSRGRLVAMDVSEPRLQEARKRLERLRLRQAVTVVLPKQNALDSRDVKPWIGQCHRVLVDAPCSGTGAWRRHAADRWRLQEEEIDGLVATQRDILTTAAKLVRANGRLVYATCSLLPDENEEQAAWFAENFPEFRSVPLSEVWPETAAGVADVTGQYLKVLPHLQNTDGFFAAVFERIR